VQAKTVVVRALSTLTTGGLGNPVVASAELAGAVGVSALAIFLPVFAIIGVLALLISTFFAIRWAWKKLRSSRASAHDTRVT
jgi:site-specific recombinase